MTVTSNPYFLDSNVWLYALLHKKDPNATDEKKRQIAIALIDSPEVVVSTQVINEVCSNLIKKAGFKEDQIKPLIQSFYDGCQVVVPNQEMLVYASDLRTQYNFSFWDGLIIAAALQAEVGILYSEDMQDKLKVKNQIEIINPFK